MATTDLHTRLLTLPGVMSCVVTEDTVVLTVGPQADPRLVKARAQVACAELDEPRPVVVGGVPTGTGGCPGDGGRGGGSLVSLSRRAPQPFLIAMASLFALSALAVVPIDSDPAGRDSDRSGSAAEVPAPPDATRVALPRPPRQGRPASAAPRDSGTDAVEAGSPVAVPEPAPEGLDLGGLNALGVVSGLSLPAQPRTVGSPPPSGPLVPPPDAPPAPAIAAVPEAPVAPVATLPAPVRRRAPAVGSGASSSSAPVATAPAAGSGASSSSAPVATAPAAARSAPRSNPDETSAAPAERPAAAGGEDTPSRGPRAHHDVDHRDEAKAAAARRGGGVGGGGGTAGPAESAQQNKKADRGNKGDEGGKGGDRHGSGGPRSKR